MDSGRASGGVPRVGAVKGCTYCYSEKDLELLGGNPALVPDDLVWSFATEVLDHWDASQYGLVWRGLAPRIVSLLEQSPEPLLLRGVPFAGFSTWPDHERAALRDAVQEVVARAITGGDRPSRV